MSNFKSKKLLYTKVILLIVVIGVITWFSWRPKTESTKLIKSSTQKSSKVNQVNDKKYGQSNIILNRAAYIKAVLGILGQYPVLLDQTSPQWKVGLSKVEISKISKVKYAVLDLTIPGEVKDDHLNIVLALVSLENNEPSKYIKIMTPILKEYLK